MQDDIVRMAQELITRHGIRMCDEDGETHGEELYCVGVEDIAEIIKQVAAHEREKHLNLANEVAWSVALAEREACAKACEELVKGFNEEADNSRLWCAAAIRARSNDAS